MKKLLLALTFCLFAPSAWAQCSGVFPPATVCGNAGGVATTPAPIPIPGSLAAPGQPVNIINFGADPTGVADSTAAIQAAIDSAAANPPNRTILCPDGNYKTSFPIFLDPPGNLRGAPSNWNSGTTYALNAVVGFNGVPYVSLANGNLNNSPTTSPTFWRPTIIGASTSSFSFTFTGNLGLGSGQTNRGCTIKPTFFNGPWIEVGPGQGMVVANMTLIGQTGAYRGQLDPNGIGICIEADGGGVNRASITNVEIDNIYTASSTGCHGGGLGAETTWTKFLAANCLIGISINQTQNDVNRVDDPSMGCVHNFIATAGPGIMVQGGNLSIPSSANNSFSISATSAITANFVSNPANWFYTFSTTIAAPDTFITGCPTNSGNCVYNSWMIQTAHFGIVPLIMTAYNSSTRVATFQMLVAWSTWALAGGVSNLGSSALVYTDIQAEIQAATTIYASERVTIFDGNAFVARNIHVENPNSCTTLIVNESGFNGDHGSLIERMRWNSAIDGSGASTAQLFCTTSFPFIDSSQSGAASITFNENAFGQGFGKGSETGPVNIDLGPQSNTPLCWFQRQGSTLSNPTVRSLGGQCKFEDPTFIPSGHGPINLDFAHQAMYAQFLPSIRYGIQGMPGLDSTLFTTLQAIAGVSFGLYFPIQGDVIYQVNGTQKLAVTTHNSFSWGQNLTTSNVSGLSWAYKGQTNVVLVDANTLGLLFPGSRIILDDGAGDGPIHYTVTGVFRFISLDGGTHPGYITVVGDGGALLTGVKTTVYTGTTIGQDSYVWKTVTLM